MSSVGILLFLLFTIIGGNLFQQSKKQHKNNKIADKHTGTPVYNRAQLCVCESGLVRGAQVVRPITIEPCLTSHPHPSICIWKALLQVESGGVGKRETSWRCARNVARIREKEHCQLGMRQKLRFLLAQKSAFKRLSSCRILYWYKRRKQHCTKYYGGSTGGVTNRWTLTTEPGRTFHWASTTQDSPSLPTRRQQLDLFAVFAVDLTIQQGRFHANIQNMKLKFENIPFHWKNHMIPNGCKIGDRCVQKAKKLGIAFFALI